MEATEAKSQKPQKGKAKSQEAKSYRSHRSHKSQEAKKPKAKKPRSQEAKKPRSQEAKKPRSQEAKSQEAKQPKATEAKKPGIQENKKNSQKKINTTQKKNWAKNSGTSVALHLSRACQCFFSTKLGKTIELIWPFLSREPLETRKFGLPQDPKSAPRPRKGRLFGHIGRRSSSARAGLFSPKCRHLSAQVKEAMQGETPQKGPGLAVDLSGTPSWSDSHH